ncbi:MAG: acidic tetraheme cytochrome c3 TmcA [Desulfonatronovibrio sp.]
MNAWKKPAWIKLIAALACIVSAAVLLPGLTLSEEDAVVIFQDNTFEQRNRGGVLFDHDEHSLFYDCEVCHHVYDDQGNLLEGVSSIDMLCSDCHALKDEGSTPGLRRAYHQQCKNCHIQDKGGPFSCAGCHINQR